MNVDNCPPLASRIHAAFAGGLPPRENFLAIATTDDEGTAEYFAGRRRDDIPEEGLVAHYIAVWFFTDEAFLYYLPAFMVAALCGSDRRNVIWGHVYAQLVGPRRRVAVVSQLSHEQRSCIVEFFRSFGVDAHEMDGGDERDIIK